MDKCIQAFQFKTNIYLKKKIIFLAKKKLRLHVAKHTKKKLNKHTNTLKNFNFIVTTFIFSIR